MTRTAALQEPRVLSTTEGIKKNILLNRLRPGDLMPSEGELCGALGVSRSSVREAIRTLSALDIVEVRHGYGTFVGNLTLAPLVEGLVFRGALSPGDTLAALREVIEVRIALDAAMANTLVDVMRGTANADLHALVEEMQKRSADGRAFPEADRAFHGGLAARLGNRLVEQLVTAFWEVQDAVYPRLGLASSDQVEETVRAHRAILRAAEAGDLEAYQSAVVAHYAPISAAMGRASLERSEETK